MKKKNTRSFQEGKSNPPQKKSKNQNLQASQQHEKQDDHITMSKNSFFFKYFIYALAGVAQWIECLSAD